MPWVVGLLGRPSGGEGGKLLGESGHLGVRLGASFIGMGLLSPDLSFFLCERGPCLLPYLPLGGNSAGERLQMGAQVQGTLPDK